MKRFNLSDVTLRLVLAVTLAVLIRPSSGQDFKGAIDQCTKEFDMDMDVVISLKYGDFSERDPLIECFTECLMKRSGFMFDDYSYNKTLIIGFAGRYLEPEGAQTVWENCADKFGTTVCVTGFEMYQCIHETAVSEWVESNF
ncbi:Odorant-binding protein 56e [Culex quinquefasciatus]|uniref:Odorant-binding protein 56e n=1 Tax=Culex quinquefasciatus TaxID=7176 RepID=B0X0F8_CULQU|nr:Odorant-binding protein 56e [Culex quinquefasciatus]|eukprot:XP_001863130.1 Odorant-binding protein 56e [Culex quinquefasciatus]